MLKYFSNGGLVKYESPEDIERYLSKNNPYGKDTSAVIREANKSNNRDMSKGSESGSVEYSGNRNVDLVYENKKRMSDRLLDNRTKVSQSGVYKSNRFNKDEFKKSDEKIDHASKVNEEAARKRSNWIEGETMERNYDNFKNKTGSELDFESYKGLVKNNTTPTTPTQVAFSDKLEKDSVDSGTTDEVIEDVVKDKDLYKIVQEFIDQKVNKEDYLKYMGSLYDSLIKDKQLANFSSRLSKSFGFLDDFRAVSGVIGDRARHAGNNIKSASLNAYNQGRGAVNRFKDDVHKRYVRIDAAKKRNELDKYDYIRMPEKCPNCGALVADYADQLSDHKFKCSECGQVFTVAGPGGQGYLKLGHNNGFDSVKNLEKKVAKQFEDNAELYDN